MNEAGEAAKQVVNGSYGVQKRAQGPYNEDGTPLGTWHSLNGGD